MTDAEKEIREALSAGPTPGPWCIHPETDGTEICAVDLVPGLPIRQVIAHPKHGANWIANARLIAACNPAAIRELLAEQAAEIEQLRAALRGWDALIRFQYTGSQEAMEAMHRCAQRTNDVIRREYRAMRATERRELA